jgi:hypothetical protein
VAAYPVITGLSRNASVHQLLARDRKLFSSMLRKKETNVAGKILHIENNGGFSNFPLSC